MKYFLEKKYFLKSLLPWHWLRLARTNKQWDQKILGFLENPVFTESTTSYRIKLNGVDVWISNYPYCFGCPADHQSFLPSRTTVIKLKEALDSYRVQELKKGG